MKGRGWKEALRIDARWNERCDCHGKRRATRRLEHAVLLLLEERGREGGEGWLERAISNTTPGDE